MVDSLSQPHDPASLAQQVIDACLAMGFALAGVAPAEATAHRQEFLEWLSAGSHGDMDYMAEHLEERLDPRVLLPGARSVIVVADQYAPRGGGEAAGKPPSAPVGIVAKYARGRDYHAVIRRRLHALCDRLRELHPGESFRAFVDTGPALEREHAARAGLGFIGKHTLLINPRLGSYLLLGGVATTLDFATTPHPTSDIPHPTSPCGTCTRCIDACPTQAITPHRVEGTRCISYLTLEHRSLIDPALHAGIGDRILGCDVCQDVCPFNHPHEDESSAARVNPAYADESGGLSALPLLDVLGWTEADRTRVLSGSAAKRASLAMIRRNAVVAAGNVLSAGPIADLTGAIQRIAADEAEDPLVRETAQQVAVRGPV
jgi:epoxyqueuosine reductase